MLALSLLQNWVVGPILMFALAVLFLRGLSRVHDRPDPDRPGPLHRDGDRLERPGEGDTEYCRRPGRLQRVFQVLFYSVYAWFFVTVLPPLLGLQGRDGAGHDRADRRERRSSTSAFRFSPAC